MRDHLSQGLVFQRFFIVSGKSCSLQLGYHLVQHIVTLDDGYVVIDKVGSGTQQRGARVVGVGVDVYDIKLYFRGIFLGNKEVSKTGGGDHDY